MPEIVKLGRLGPVAGRPFQERLTTPGLRYNWDQGYDEGYFPQLDQEYNRSDNQSALGQLWNGFWSRGLSIGTKIGSGIGAVTAIPSALYNGDVSKLWDNPINEAMDGADEWLKMNMPVYQSKQYAEGDLLRKLGTSSFWTSDFFDGLAYLASAYAPGGLIGKGIQAGSKAIKATETGAKMAKGLAKVGLNSQRGSLVAATAYNTITEATAEAYQTQKEIETLLVSQGVDAKTAKLKAGQAAAETFWWNSAALLLPNYVQNSFFHGGWDDKIGEARKLVWGNKEKAVELAKSVNVWKPAISGIASEGLWEENIQTSIQQYERRFAQDLTDHNMAAEVGLNMAHNIKGFAKSFLPGTTTTKMEDEGAVSIFIGGLLGGLSGVGRGMADKQAMSSAIKGEQARYDNLFKTIGPAAANFFIEDVKSTLKKNGTVKIPGPDGTEIEVDNFETFTDENGEVQFRRDPEAMLRRSVNDLNNTKHWDAAMVAAYTNDKLMADYNDEMALSAYAYKLATDPQKYSKEEIAQYLDSLAEIGTEEAKRLGKDSFIKENTDKVKEYVNALDQIDKETGSIAAENTDPDELAANNFVKRNKYYVNTKLNALNRIKALPIKRPETLQTIDALIADATEQLELLVTDEKQIKDLYKSRVRDSMKQLGKLQELKAKTSKSAEDLTEIAKIEYLFEESQAVNGTYESSTAGDTNVDATFGLTSAVPIRHQTRVRPGTREANSYRIGKQVLALEDIATDLANKEDTRGIAYKFLNAVSLENPGSSSAQTQIVGRINNDIDELDNENAVDELFLEFFNTVLNSAGEGKSVRQIAEELAREDEDSAPDQAAVDQMLNAVAAMDLEQPVTQEMIDRHEAMLMAKTKDLAIATKNRADEMAQLGTIAEAVKKAFESEASTRAARFEATEDKEWFLINEYLDDRVIALADSVIDRFENNPDAFDDYNGVNNALRELKKAKAAFETRDDITDEQRTKTLDAIKLYTDKIQNEIYPVLLERATRRTQKQIQSNFDATVFGLQSLGLITGDGDRSTTTESYKLIESILGTAKLEEVLEEILGSEIPSYDGVGILLDKVKALATPEQLKALLAQLDVAVDTNIKGIKGLFPGPTPKNLLDGKEYYKNLPHILIKEIVIRLFPDKVNDRSSIAYKFIQDYDLNDFVIRSKNDPSFSDEERATLAKLRVYHLRLVEALSTKNFLESSELVHATAFQVKKELTVDIKPSLQQNIVLTEILRFLFRITKTVNFGNWFVLQGIGGSGKSLVVSNLLTKIFAKLTGSNLTEAVVAIGHTVDTSKNINDAIFGAGKKLTTLETFLAMTDDQLTKVKVLIVDEAFAFTDEAIQEIQGRLSLLASEKNHTIKVVAMGDPSQSTASTNPVLLTGQTAGATHTIPLTTSYRTNVSAISAFAGNFRLSNAENNNIGVQANVSIEQAAVDNNSTIGVITASDEEVIDFIVQTKSSRSRVLVAPTRADAVLLSRRIGGIIPVKTPNEIQGLQWDEVYVVGLREAYGTDNVSINRGLYTAFSRAKGFLMVSNNLGASQLEPNPSILNESYDTSMAELTEQATIYDTFIESSTRVLNSLNGVTNVSQEDLEVPDVTQEAQQIDTPPDIAAGDIKQAAILDELEESPTSPTEVTVEPEAVTHLAAYPVNYALTGSLGSVAPGSTAHVVRILEGNKSVYYVLAPNRGVSNYYVVVGVLGAYDFDTPITGEFFSKTITNKPDVYLDSAKVTKDSTGMYVPDIAKLSLGQLKVVKASPMRAMYNEAARYMSSDIIEDTIIRFYDSYFGLDAAGRMFHTKEYGENPANDWVINGKVNWKVLKGKVQVRIFSKNNPSGSAAAKLTGVPYLVINDPSQQNATKIAKPIYIRLQPAGFSKDSKYYKPLRELYDIARSIEALHPDLELGGEMLHDLLVAYTEVNFEVKDKPELGTASDKDKRYISKLPTTTSSETIVGEELGEIDYSALDQLLDQLVLLTRSVKGKIYRTTDEEQARGYVGQVLDGKYKIVGYHNITKSPTATPVYVLDYASETNTDNTEVYRQYEIVSDAGEAQAALNAIARANRFIGGARIRTKFKIVERGKEVKLTRAASITSPESFIDFELFYDELGEELNISETEVLANADPGRETAYLIEEIIKRNSGKIVQTESGPIKVKDEYSVNQILHNYRISPVTTILLGLIVGDQYFANNGRHTITYKDGSKDELREPLHMDHINYLGGSNVKGQPNPRPLDESARAELSSLLSSSFQGISKTQVVLLPIDTEDDARPKAPQPKNLGEALDLVKGSTGHTHLDRLITLFKDNAKLRAVPIYTYKEIDGSKELTETVYTKDGKTYIRTAVDFSTIAEDPQRLSVLLHEAIHAVTIGSIQRARKKKGSEEDVLFYRTIVKLQKKFNAYVQFTRKMKLSEVYQKTSGKYDVNEFIANLSNKKFVELASSKTLGDVLVEFFHAVLRLLGLTPDTTIYDASFDALERLIHTYTDIAIPASEEDIQKDVDKLVDQYKSSIKATIKTYKDRLQDAEEQEDEEGIELYTSQLRQLYETETGIYDFQKDSLEPGFSSKNANEQLSIIKAKLNIRSGSEDEVSKAAYVTPEPVVIRSTPGSLLVTTGVASFVAQTFPNLQTRESFLMRSIIQNQIVEPESKLILQITEAFKEVNDPQGRLKFLNLFYNDIFTWRDRDKVRRELGAASDYDAMLYMQENFATLDVTLSMANVAISLESHKSEIEFLVADTTDKNIDRYIQAKQFVLQELYNNMHSTGLVRTKLEMLASISARVSEKTDNKMPNPFLLEMENELNEMIARATTLAAKLDKLNSAERLEYNNLINKSIPQQENKLYGIKSLGKKNLVTGRTILSDIMKDINPKSRTLETKEFSDILTLGAVEIADLERAIETREDREIKESTGINEYIENYNKSYELTLSESLKDFLSFIPTGQGGFFNSGLAYIKTLQLVISLDWDTRARGLTHILDQLTSLRNSTSLSDLDLAIVNNLRKLLSEALTTQDLTTYNPLANNMNIVSRTHPSGRVTYSAVFSATQDVSKLTYWQAKQAKDVQISAEYETTRDLFEWLNRQAPLQISVFNTLFRRAEAINAIRELHNGMASMRENDLYIATRRNRKGATFAYMRAKAIDVTFGIKEDMQHHLRDLHQKDKLRTFKDDFKRIHPASWKAIRTKTTPLADQVDAILVFLRFLGINVQDATHLDNKWRLTINESNVTKLIEDLEGFMDLTKNVLTPEKDLDVDADVQETEIESTGKTSQFKSINDWLDNVDGYLTRFSELVSRSSEMLRNMSVKDSKNNKYYKIHEGSWGTDTLDALVRRKPTNEYKGTKGSSAYGTLPEHLMTDFFRHNIFVNGINYISARGEHDAAKNLDNNSVTPLTRENVFFFYHREFVQGFLNGAQQYSGQEYFNFLYPPSDKPKYPLIRVKILSDVVEDADPYSAETHRAFKAAFKQIMDKEGTSFKFSNYDKSLLKDKFRNFEIGLAAINASKLELDEANLDKIVEKAIELAKAEASKLLAELTSDEVQLTFDKATYDILRMLNNKVRNPIKDLPTSNFTSKITNAAGEREYVVEHPQVEPYFQLFFLNHYINNYFANQLISGDYAFYKNDTSDLVKRFAGILAPGIRPLVDSSIGMDNKFRILVLKDTNVPISDTTSVLQKLLYGDEELTAEQKSEFNRLMSFFDENGYDRSDAQGFMLPSRFNDLTRGFGRAWNIGNVMKPVYFDVTPVTTTREDGTTYTTGMPRYVKYSSVVLEDSLVSKFPILQELRRKMEMLKVGEMVMGSAVKEGAPIATRSVDFKSLINMSDTDAMTLLTDEVPPIMELENIHYRFQHNPLADPNKQVAIYSQLMYFLNVYEGSQDAARTAYQLVGELIKMGREEFIEKLNSGGIRKYLASKFDGPGAERALELINAGISLDNPLLEKKSVIALSSGLDSATVKVKFKGGKLVLQTSEGVKLDVPNLDKATYELGKELTYKRGTFNGQSLMYAEVIVPKSMLTPEQLEVMDKGGLFLYGDGLAFRIPSTELHSAIPFRVVGTYSNEDTNVIIAPKELVPIHGSDFDVDALFVIMRENYDKNNISYTSAESIGVVLDIYKDTYSTMLATLKTVEDVNGRAVLNKFFDGITKRMKIYLDDESYDNPEALSIEEQLSVEKKYREFIDTPVFASWAGKEIVRRKSMSFNDAKARAEFGAQNGYKFAGSMWLRMKDSAVETINTITEEVDKLQLEYPALFAEYPNVKRLMEKVRKIKEDLYKLSDDQTLGSINSPIGYRVNDANLYELDPGYGDTLDEAITELNNVLTSLPTDFIHVFKPRITKELKKLAGLKKSYIRNAVTETMMKTITAEQNRMRMVYPIAFNSLTNAIDKILVTSGLSTIEEAEANRYKLSESRSDLSNVAHKQRAYSALADGVVLTGAFANAVKVLAYLSRAGADAGVVEFFDAYAKSKARLATLESLEMLTDGEKLELDRLKKTIKDQFAKAKFEEVIKSSRNVEGPAFINPMFAFKMKIDGKSYTFDRMKNKQVDDLYNLTEVFDALINAAIDNLKLGYLSRARINSRTGSFVVGALFMGVPIDSIVKILYQPIFDPLVTGKINNVNRDFLAKILEDEKYAKRIKELEDTTLDSADLDAVLMARGQQGAMAELSLTKLTAEQVDIQLQAFSLFAKAHKIGEDVRNLSDFMRMIRYLDVFIEDIDGHQADLTNKLGIVDKDNIFISRLDFSFVIPFMLVNNPHLLEAYETYKAQVDIINKNFKVHSPEVRSLVDKAYSGLSLLDEDEDSDLEANLAEMRRSLIGYLLNETVWNSVADIEPAMVTIKGTNGLKMLKSPARTFAERTAEKLRKIKTFAIRQGHDNTFLANISITTGEYGIVRVSYKGGVNTNSSDRENAIKGFMNLNRYTIDDQGNVSSFDPPSPNYLSPMQQDLLDYAIIVYGLEFSTSNYSSFIPATMLSIIDESLNSLLDELVKKEGLAKAKQKVQHFKIYYAIKNADRLPFLSSENSVPTSEYASSGTPARVVKVYNGMDMVTIEAGRDIDGNPIIKEVPVYYDRKVKRIKGRRNAEFLKKVDNNRIEVYMKVHTEAEFEYYQKVGKTSESFYTKMPTDGYSVKEYFNPHEFTLLYTETKPGKFENKPGQTLNIISFTYPEALNAKGEVFKFLSVGDEFWISPGYSADRTKRIRVKLLDEPKKIDSIYKGHSYKVEIIPGVETAPDFVSDEQKMLDELQNQCKI